jgi:hypothetical protein
VCRTDDDHGRHVAKIQASPRSHEGAKDLFGLFRYKKKGRV